MHALVPFMHPLGFLRRMTLKEVHMGVYAKMSAIAAMLPIRNPRVLEVMQNHIVMYALAAGYEMDEVSTILTTLPTSVSNDPHLILQYLWFVSSLLENLLNFVGGVDSLDNMIVSPEEFEAIPAVLPPGSRNIPSVQNAQPPARPAKKTCRQSVADTVYVNSHLLDDVTFINTPRDVVTPRNLLQWSGDEVPVQDQDSPFSAGLPDEWFFNQPLLEWITLGDEELPNHLLDSLDSFNLEEILNEEPVAGLDDLLQSTLPASFSLGLPLFFTTPTTTHLPTSLEEPPYSPVSSTPILPNINSPAHQPATAVELKVEEGVVDKPEPPPVKPMQGGLTPSFEKEASPNPIDEILDEFVSKVKARKPTPHPRKFSFISSESDEEPYEYSSCVSTANPESSYASPSSAVDFGSDYVYASEIASESSWGSEVQTSMPSASEQSTTPEVQKQRVEVEDSPVNSAYESMTAESSAAYLSVTRRAEIDLAAVIIENDIACKKFDV